MTNFAAPPMLLPRCQESPAPPCPRTAALKYYRRHWPSRAPLPTSRKPNLINPRCCPSRMVHEHVVDRRLPGRPLPCFIAHLIAATATSIPPPRSADSGPGRLLAEHPLLLNPITLAPVPDMHAHPRRPECLSKSYGRVLTSLLMGIVEGGDHVQDGEVVLVLSAPRCVTAATTWSGLMRGFESRLVGL